MEHKRDYGLRSQQRSGSKDSYLGCAAVVGLLILCAVALSLLQAVERNELILLPMLVLSSGVAWLLWSNRPHVRRFGVRQLKHLQRYRQAQLEQLRQAELQRRIETERQKEVARLEAARQQELQKQAGLLRQKQRREQHEKWIIERERQSAENTRQMHEAATIGKVDTMTGPQFEEFLADLFEQQGYSVERLGGSGDQGADLLLIRDRHKIVVQAKRWTGPVTNKAVQEVWAGMSFYGAQEAWVVTPSNFTQGAREAAERIGVKLIDRVRLIEWLSDILEWSGAPPTTETPAEAKVRSYFAVFCPACGEDNPHDANFCRRCRQPLSIEAQSISRMAPELKQASQYVKRHWTRIRQLERDSHQSEDARRRGELYRRSMTMELEIEPYIVQLGDSDPSFGSFKFLFSSDDIVYFRGWYKDVRAVRCS